MQRQNDWVENGSGKVKSFLVDVTDDSVCNYCHNSPMTVLREGENLFRFMDWKLVKKLCPKKGWQWRLSKCERIYVKFFHWNKWHYGSFLCSWSFRMDCPAAPSSGSEESCTTRANLLPSPLSESSWCRAPSCQRRLATSPFLPCLVRRACMSCAALARSLWPLSQIFRWSISSLPFKELLRNLLPRRNRWDEFKRWVKMFKHKQVRCGGWGGEEREGWAEGVGGEEKTSE